MSEKTRSCPVGKVKRKTRGHVVPSGLIVQLIAPSPIRPAAVFLNNFPAAANHHICQPTLTMSMRCRFT